MFLQAADIQINAVSRTPLVEPVEWKAVIFRIPDKLVSHIVPKTGYIL
jgi:hypothetical protein